MEMKAVLAQTHISWENKAHNYKKAEYMIKESAQKGAGIVFFPEMSFTGFSMNIEVTGETRQETVKKMAEYSAEYGIYIGFGWVNLREGKAENHYSVAAPSKEIILDYIKIHPFSYGKENTYFRPGDTIVSCQAEELPMTAFICYDLRFPELFQAVQEPTTLAVVAANWPESRREHWKLLLKARAVENQIYIAGVNCTGSTGGVSYSGDSCLISPNGRQLQSLEYEEGLIFCEIGDEAKTQRESFPFRKDRRKSLYRTWYE
ncbi:MAG: carbon-nitrogen family hydrolase [Hungatella sp.]|jgi:predicted amidohydrolase|nr:carbon-nitrogen family hydrolase [Hungatella sp.]